MKTFQSVDAAFWKRLFQSVRATFLKMSQSVGAAIPKELFRGSISEFWGTISERVVPECWGSISEGVVPECWGSSPEAIVPDSESSITERYLSRKCTF